MRLHHCIKNGNPWWTKKGLQACLGIKHRATINQYLNTLKIPKKDWYSVDDLNRCLELKAFLQAGEHSHRQFRALLEHGLVEKALLTKQIEVNYYVQSQFHSHRKNGRRGDERGQRKQAYSDIREEVSSAQKGKRRF